jgi:glycopeptide antibiotics resistance protein
MLGVCDIDDLMLNTLGGTIGYLLFLLLKKMIHSGGQSSISLEKV